LVGRQVALKWVEEELLRRGHRLIERVISTNATLRGIHARAVLSSIFSIATSSPERISSARLLPHATRTCHAHSSPQRTPMPHTAAQRTPTLRSQQHARGSEQTGESGLSSCSVWSDML
jgi:hypothetical protein